MVYYTKVECGWSILYYFSGVKWSRVERNGERFHGQSRNDSFFDLEKIFKCGKFCVKFVKKLLKNMKKI